MGDRNNDIGRELDLKIEIIHNYIQEGFTVGQIAEMIGYGYAGLYNAIKRSKYRDAISIKNNHPSELHINSKIISELIQVLKSQNAYPL